jgi:mannonate dehydratase
MKLGFNFYRHMLTPENFRFARQCGATHAVIHLVDYFKKKDDDTIINDQPVDNGDGWGVADREEDFLWTLEYMLQLKKELNEYGLEWYAIENFNPAHWYDILLDVPKKKEQIEFLKQIICNMGKAGIPCMGYNFSIAGVTGRVKQSFARGGAESVGMRETNNNPLPEGLVWNMQVDSVNHNVKSGQIMHDELWTRLNWFLNELLPVAEEAGVILAAHPDDPPVPFLRQTPRLVYQPQLYDKLINTVQSTSNQLEFCLGSLAEMTDGDIYDVTEKYSQQQKIGYIHFRNIKGKAPNYREVFIDEGDIDMIKILRILKKNNYQGVLVPDHTPQMSCDAPWHAGMAYAMGYMKAAIELI